MKGKLFPTLDMKNKRWTALLAAGALVAAIGVGSVYAATASSSLLVKVEDGGIDTPVILRREIHVRSVEGEYTTFTFSLGISSHTP